MSAPLLPLNPPGETSSHPWFIPVLVNGCRRASWLPWDLSGIEVRGNCFLSNKTALKRLKAVVKKWSSIKEGFKGLQMVSGAACLYSAQQKNLGIPKKSAGFVS